MFFSLKRRPRNPSHDAARPALELCQALMSEHGELSGARLAVRALDACDRLQMSAVADFFTLLLTNFAPDPTALRRAAEQYGASPSPAALVALQVAVESPRQELFRRLNMAPGGTAALVRWRHALLESLPRHPEWAPIDADLLHLFRSWFNRGFLTLQRIDWNTPAVVLERLIEYEAVHQIQGWRDLRRRLQADRRCYGFFHPALPNEPLIFIEIALTRGLPPTVQELIAPDSAERDPQRADHAVFYSITNCQAGLRGVSFGNFLIKQVAEDLGREFPNLRVFVTLSPVPGLVAWWRKGRKGTPRVSPELAAVLDAAELTPELLRDLPASARQELMLLATGYLLTAKRGDRAPEDAVARFHLANGARLERLNWMGDTSPAGIARSFGITANYSYNLADVERNHEAYATEYRVVASRSLARLQATAARRAARKR